MSASEKQQQIDETTQSGGATAETEEAASAPQAEHQTEAGREPEPEAATSGEETAESRARALAEQVAELNEQVLRARAEVENVLRRTQREKQDIAAYAISDFARSLLPVADNLRRALEAVPAEQRNEEHIKALIDGVEMTEKELLAAFEKHGLRKVDPAGEKFDHNYHQAMAEVDAPDRQAGTVVDVYQSGYVIKDRLLRPAMVTVAKGGPKQGAAQGGGVDTEA